MFNYRRPFLLHAASLLFLALLLMSASAPGGAKRADRARAEEQIQTEPKAAPDKADPPVESQRTGPAVRPSAKRKGIHLRSPHKRRLKFKKVRRKHVRPAQRTEDNPNKHANTALICGILCLTVANLIFIGGPVCAILAIAHGVQSLRAEEPARGAAMAGIVMGGIFCMLMLLAFVYLMVILVAFI